MMYYHFIVAVFLFFILEHLVGWTPKDLCGMTGNFHCVVEIGLIWFSPNLFIKKCSFTLYISNNPVKRNTLIIYEWSRVLEIRSIKLIDLKYCWLPSPMDSPLIRWIYFFYWVNPFCTSVYSLSFIFLNIKSTKDV